MDPLHPENKLPYLDGTKIVQFAESPAKVAAMRAGKLDLSKQVPIIMGDGIKRIQPNEFDTLNTQRKSIYAATNIKKGSVITKDMVVTKGPGGGLLPKYLDIVVGREARKDIEEDHPITWKNI